MLFRYYSWLPLELEPEYLDGFSCDKCGKDFLSGPLYHQQASGTDYCIPCGESRLLSFSSGLICALLFTEGELTMRDMDTGSVALMGYRVSKCSYGIYFSDRCSLRFDLRREKVRNVLYVSKNETTSLSRWEARFPWLSSRVLDQFALASELHSTPDDSGEAGELYVVEVTTSHRFISLKLSGGWEQFLDSENGTEVVCKDGRVVAITKGDSIQALTPQEVQSLYDMSSLALRDSSHADI